MTSCPPFPSVEIRDPRAELRRRRFEYCPWLYRDEANDAEREEQAAWLRALQAELGVEAGDGCYVAPGAVIVGDPGASLRMGMRCSIAAASYITGRITMGDDCTINPYAVVRDVVVLGNGVRIGAHASLIGQNHGFARTDIPVWRQPNTSKGIVVGDDVWIGANAVVLDGVRIGSHVIVGGGAVVTRDVPDYAIVGGNPARAIRMRTPTVRNSSMGDALEEFGVRAAFQLGAIQAHYRAQTADGGACYVNRPGDPKRVRPNCDMVELSAMFQQVPSGRSAEEWVLFLGSLQAPETGLVSEHLSEDRARDPLPPGDPALAPRYNTMAVLYALECLGAAPACPVANAAALSGKRIAQVAASLNWATGAWSAGDWIDCLASCLYGNGKYFGDAGGMDDLFAWLDERCDPESGMWGEPGEAEGWLQPVNGFYRLTRGTYAQFGRPLPHPERAIDTILRHAADPRHFGEGKDYACTVLDVVHPLWLCLRQTSHRRDEAEAWVRARLPGLLDRWVDGGGFAFHPTAPEPDLQGTEMWLAVIFLMADLLGEASLLGYRPRGVHRLEAAGAGLLQAAGKKKLTPCPVLG